MEFNNIIQNNLHENTFILYGYLKDMHWKQFADACREFNKEAVVITHKSTDVEPYQYKPYPAHFRVILSYPKLLHWEVSQSGLDQVLKNKAKIYKKQYGGIIVNDLLLCGDRTRDGYKAPSISGSFWNTVA